MLWLFGEIWLWLLLAFVLGLALAAFTFLAVRRRGHAPADDHPTDTTSQVTAVSETERTQLIPRVRPQQYADQRPPETAGPSSGPPSDVDDTPGEGRLQGTLPVSSSEWHVRNEWPDERDIRVAEENRPRRER